MSEQDNIKAAQSFFEAWNAGDLSMASAYEADNFLAEGTGIAAPLNADQNRAFNQNFLTAFPGSKFEVLRTITQGDYVVANWMVRGTNNGPLQTPSGGSIPPTGKMATVYGSTTFQMKDGKIVHSWAHWDSASLLIQLGLMPPM